MPDIRLLASHRELETFVRHPVDHGHGLTLLELATSAVLNVAEIGVFEATDVVVLDGSGARSVLLPSWPVTDVQQVTVDGAVVQAFTWSRTGELRRDHGVWPARLRAIEVTYTHGYPDDQIPGELKTVCLQAAARGLGNPQRLNSFGDGQVQAGFGGGGTGVQVLELYASEAAMVQRALR